MKKILTFILDYFNLYTENEVRKILVKIQYEMAQKVIGNRENNIIPTEYFDNIKKSMRVGKEFYEN